MMNNYLNYGACLGRRRETFASCGFGFRNDRLCVTHKLMKGGVCGR